MQLPTTLASDYSNELRHSNGLRRTNFAENSRLGFERLLTNRSESVAPHQKNKSNFALQYCDVETITACCRTVQRAAELFNAIATCAVDFQKKAAS
jgi:hypothetical protein